MQKTKHVTVHFRRWVRVLIVLTIAAFLMAGALALVFKLSYAVSLNGEFLGYTDNKSEMQQRINEYIAGEEDKQVAFIDVASLPQYDMLFLKRDVPSNDEEIYNQITKDGVKYYHYYAIAEDGEDKHYLASYSDAKEVMSQLEDKDSANYDDLKINEKYETELKDFESIDDIVDDLYVKKVTYSGEQSSTNEIITAKLNLGMTLRNPCSGILTSRYGYRWGGIHSGIDIGADYGTPIHAAQSGTVTMSQYYGGYGYCVQIAHGNGVSTLYGHASTLIAEVGDVVKQGDVIALVGSTGQSTGNHCHFEVRVDGATQNPLNYVNY